MASRSASAPSGDGSAPPSKPQISVSITGDPSKVIEAFTLLLGMKPSHVIVSRGTPGPEEDRRAPGDLTVRYNVFVWDE